MINKIIKIFRKSKPGLYKYKNYEEYKQVQIDGNINKLDKIWVMEEDVRFISEYIKKNVIGLKFGICHGTRQGKEQEWFSKYLNISVIGTEISPTAKDFSNTIEWDFHEIKNEWIDGVDFIYSNSFDHSYKPTECLDAWMSCIKKEGICILEWTKKHEKYTRLDPFGGTLDDYKKMITKKYRLKDILENTIIAESEKKFLVISHLK